MLKSKATVWNIRFVLALLPKIIVILGSIFLLLGAGHPWITVSVYMIFRPLIQPFSWLQYKLFGLPVALPFTIIILLLGILYPFIKNKWSITVEKSAFFISFVILGILTAITSDYPGASFAALAKLLTVWFIFNIAYNSVTKKEDAIHIVDAMIISSIFPLMFGFYQAITGNYDIIYDAEVDRVSSVFATGNSYGIYLTIITTATAIRLGTTTSRNVRYIMLGMLSLILVSQVLSLNRGTWLALAMGFIVAAIKYRRHINFKMLTIGGIVFLLLFSGKIIQRFQELNDPSAVHYHATTTLEGRFTYWNELLPVIMDKAIIGHGIGSSTKVSEKYIGTHHKTHNDYVLVALEMGLLGLFIYLAFLARIFAYFILMPVKKDLWIWNFAMLMLVVYFIIISGTQNIVETILTFPLFMVLLAITFKLNRMERTRNIHEEEPTKLDNPEIKDSSILRPRKTNRLL